MKASPCTGGDISDDPSMPPSVADWSADGEDDRKGRDAGYLTDSVLSGRGGRGGFRRGARGGFRGRGGGLPPRGPGQLNFTKILVCQVLMLTVFVKYK